MSLLPTSTLEEFKNQLNNENKSFKIKEEQQQQNNIIKIRKNIVLSFVADATGCGHIRCVFPMTYLHSVFGKSGRLVSMISPFFLLQPDILAKTRTLYFQRTMSPKQIPLVNQYRQWKEKYNYSMIFDLDDYLWRGDDNIKGLDSYNFGSENVTDEVRDSCVQIMKLMDKITVSTEFLKKYLVETLQIKVPIIVLPNCIPKYFFNKPNKQPINKKIEKPRIIYSGSPTHWHQDKKLLGDWESGQWLEFIKKNIRDDKIDFICLACQKAPFFFSEFEGRNNFKTVPWVNSYQYYSVLNSFNADFGISILIDNYFNRSKSFLKQEEYSAAGILGIGTVFTTNKWSPYEVCKVKVNEKVTVKELEDLFEYYCWPEHYNKVITEQYQWLINDGLYLESAKYVNRLTSIL